MGGLVWPWEMCTLCTLPDPCMMGVFSGQTLAVGRAAARGEVAARILAKLTRLILIAMVLHLRLLSLHLYISL